jgi:hypothetical protein
LPPDLVLQALSASAETNRRAMERFIERPFPAVLPTPAAPASRAAGFFD